MELTAAFLGVTGAGGAVALLGALDELGSSLQAALTIIGLKWQGIDQGVGGGADLAESDLRIFFS